MRPGLTLTAAHGALHQAIVGDRLRLSLDEPLCREVTGEAATLAHPMLVCDVAIGQSTGPSGRVLGNLFYRGLAARAGSSWGDAAYDHDGRGQAAGELLASPAAGDGAAACHGASMPQIEVVLDYYRCPLLPARGDDPDEAGDDVRAVAENAPERDVHDLVPTPGAWRSATRAARDPVRGSAPRPILVT